MTTLSDRLPIASRLASSDYPERRGPGLDLDRLLAQPETWRGGSRQRRGAEAMTAAVMDAVGDHAPARSSSRVTAILLIVTMLAAQGLGLVMGMPLSLAALGVCLGGCALVPVLAARHPIGPWSLVGVAVCASAAQLTAGMASMIGVASSEVIAYAAAAIALVMLVAAAVQTVIGLTALQAKPDLPARVLCCVAVLAAALPVLEAV
jgi:hypothetical protein